MTFDSYDEIPYDSTPVYEIHPDNMAVPGRLFGLDPAPARRCRYLEFGCASGGNLIPLAWYLPDSEFVGIERSAGQVQAGRALIESLGLRNVRIEHADVLAVEPDAFGHFDYIVAHGFYSWVPPPVRRRMFEIVAASLAPQGIAYVSYNTLPGWRLRGMLRDVLRYQTRECRSPRERLTAAYGELERFQEVLAGQDDVISRMLHEEVARLRTRHPSYLYHEYLVDENTPMLFSEFMDEAGRHGLQYLCEAELQTMFGDGFGDAAQAWIDGHPDVIGQEQAMDFLRQHMFRQTLLCRQGIPVQRELALEQFADLAYHASLQPVEPPDLRRAVAQSFRGPDGGTCEVIHPLAKAALLELGERHPDALAFSDLVTRARLRLQAEGGDDTVPDEDLLMELVRLYLHQQIGASPEAEQVPRAGLNRPCASGLARAQAAAGNGHVSTRRHKPMGIDAFVTALLRHLHGRHHRSELADLLYEDVVAGRLELDHEIPAGAALRSAMQANVGRMLAMLAHHGVLEPEDEGQG